VKAHATPVANPFTNLSDGGKQLEARGVDVARLRAMKKSLLLSGNHWAKRQPFVNADPDVVLVLGKGFNTSAPVYSLGPVVAVEGAHPTSGLTGADLVWLTEKAISQDTTTGAPVVVHPAAQRSALEAGNKLLWHGEYGWRRPDGWPEMRAKD
jgi:hypothetical protein